MEITTTLKMENNLPSFLFLFLLCKEETLKQIIMNCIVFGERMSQHLK